MTPTKILDKEILKEALIKSYQDARWSKNISIGMAKGFLENNDNVFSIEIIKKAISLTQQKAQEIFEKKIEALNKLNKENLYGYALSNANDNVNKIFGDKSTKGDGE